MGGWDRYRNVLIKNESGYELTRGTDQSAGYDLRYIGGGELRLPALNSKVIGTGIHLKLPDDTAGFVVSRSGIAAKEGIIVINSPGIIDPDYTGEIKLALYNTNPYDTREIKPGTRVAQLLFIPFLVPGFIKYNVGNIETERGSNGFGSTGSI